MKKSLASLELLFLSAALTTLAACGGGGGGDDNPSPTPPAPSPGSATPAPPPPVGSPPPPPAPAPAGTGLSEPSLALTLEARDAVMLARKMADAGNAAAGAAATMALGPIDPGTEGAAATTDCAQGGTVSYVNTSSSIMTYTYSACQISGYTFNGTSTVSTNHENGVLANFTVDFNNLQVSGAGAPAAVTGELRCQAPTVAGQAPACISSYATFVWGWDMSLTSEGMSGTHQCTCSHGTWNVHFDKFTAAAGTAYVYATNGTATVTRNGVRAFRVVLTVEGTTQAFDIVLAA
jgi:hypothetical protein